MMAQTWFEMAEIRRGRLAPSAWLRAIQPLREKGKRGNLAFKEEFFGAGSLPAHFELKQGYQTRVVKR